MLNLKTWPAAKCNHLCNILTVNDSKVLDKSIVSELLAKFRGKGVDIFLKMDSALLVA